MKGLEMSVLLTAVQTELTNTEKVRLTDEHTTTGPNLEHLENKEITTNSNSNETIADLASFNQHDTITGTQKIPVIKSTSDSDYSKTSKGTENDIKSKIRHYKRSRNTAKTYTLSNTISTFFCSFYIRKTLRRTTTSFPMSQL